MRSLAAGALSREQADERVTALRDELLDEDEEGDPGLLEQPDAVLPDVAATRPGPTTAEARLKTLRAEGRGRRGAMALRREA